MGIEPSIDITVKQRKTILTLLERHLPGTEVWVYGSRVTWTSCPQSDLDMVVFATLEQKLAISDLREAFEDSNLPFRVDLFVWNDVPDSFRKQIKRKHAVLVCKKMRDQPSKWLETVYGRFVADFSEDFLANLCDKNDGIQTGPFGSQLHKKDYVLTGTPIVTVEHLGENRLSHHNLPRVSESDRRRLSKYTLRKGDIVFSRVGSVDRRALVRREEEGWLFSGRCLRVRSDPVQIDSGFLSYFFGLPTFRAHIKSIAVGATMPSLNTQILSDVKVFHPILPEQRAIARILGALDDKIELNRQMNEALEVIARSVFKDWFADFGPVRAKMEGRDPYLPPEIWKLFPDALDEEGKPAGWMRRSLGKLFDVSIGRTPPRKEHQHFVPSGTGRTWLAIKGMKNSQTFALASDEDLTTDAIEKFRVPVVPAGTVMVSFKLTVGRVAIASKDMYSNEAIAHLVENHDTPVGNIFTYCFMKDFDYDSLSSTSSIATAVNSKSIRAIELIVPDAVTHSAFAVIVQPIFDRILRNLSENGTLMATRDLLLPKLMSGEMRLSDVERAVKAVA